MLKISKLTDYGLLASVYLARKHGEVVSARDIAAFYQLPLPMITKVLKTLHQGGVIESQRGVSGGYAFTRDHETITLPHPIARFDVAWGHGSDVNHNHNGHGHLPIPQA